MVGRQLELAAVQTAHVFACRVVMPEQELTKLTCTAHMSLQVLFS